METGSAAVKSTASAEATMESSTGCYVPTTIASAVVACSAVRPANGASIAAVPRTISVSSPIRRRMRIVAVAIPAVPVISMPTPAIPGTCTDKDAADKPVRTIIAVRRASIRIIGVITPGANRRSIIQRHRSLHNSWPNPNTYSDLRLSNNRKRQCENECE
jgi:hypothetical protein